MVAKTVSLEMVGKRLKLYETELQRLLQSIKIYEGAIQDCKYWQTVLEQKEEDKND